MKILKNVFALVAIIFIAMEVLIAAKYTLAYLAGPEKPSTTWIVLSEIGDAIRSFHVKLPYFGPIGFQPKAAQSSSSLLPEVVMLLVFGFSAIIATAVAVWLRAIEVRSLDFKGSQPEAAASPDILPLEQGSIIARSQRRLTGDGKAITDEVH